MPSPALPRVYVPPDPSLAGVELPALIAALSAELASAAEDARARGGASSGDAVTDPSAATDGFRRVVSMLEGLLSLESVATSRDIRRRLAPFDPRAPPRDDAPSPSSPSPSLEDAEVDALDGLVDLLLAARYAPLTAEQWRSARQNQFTFDVPVRIDWSALDPLMLRRYFGMPTTAEAAAAAMAEAVAAAGARNGGGAGSPGLSPWLTASFSSNSDDEDDNGGGGEAPVLLPGYWRSLPAFSDRVLVFVRGVGASSARGQYYDEKLDLLVSYVLLEPLSQLASKAWAALGAPLAQAALRRSRRLRRLAAWLEGDDWAHAAEWRALDGGDADDADEQEGESAAEGRRRPRRRLPPGVEATLCKCRSAALDRLEKEAASADAGAAGAAAGAGRGRPRRFVERRALRTLLPTVPAVGLSLLREEVLTEPTFQEVIVIYRRTAPSTDIEAERQARGLTRREALELEVANRRAARKQAKLEAAAGAAAGGIRTAAAAATIGGAVGGAVGQKLAGGLGATAGTRIGSAVGGALGSFEELVGKAKAVVGGRDAAATGVAAGADASRSSSDEDSDGDDVAAPAAAAGGVFNDKNIQLHAFKEVAMADIELVFPEKRVLVQPLTLLRLGITAASAASAGLIWLLEAPPSSFSLLLGWSALSVLAAKATSLWASVQAHQQDLERTMTSMQYDRSSASGPGVVTLLAEELGAQQLKEAVTCYGVMLALALAPPSKAAAGPHGGARGGAAASGDAWAPAGGGAGAGGMRALRVSEIAAACERFIAREFSLNVNLQIRETLQRMLEWGIVTRDDVTGGYVPAPPGAAADAIFAVWERNRAAGGDGGWPSEIAGRTSVRLGSGRSFSMDGDDNGGAAAAAAAAAAGAGGRAVSAGAAAAREARARAPRGQPRPAPRAVVPRVQAAARAAAARGGRVGAAAAGAVRW